MPDLHLNNTFHLYHLDVTVHCLPQSTPSALTSHGPLNDSASPFRHHSKTIIQIRNHWVKSSLYSFQINRLSRRSKNTNIKPIFRNYVTSFNSSNGNWNHIARMLYCHKSEWPMQKGFLNAPIMLIDGENKLLFALSVITVTVYEAIRFSFC